MDNIANSTLGARLLQILEVGTHVSNVPLRRSRRGKTLLPVRICHALRQKEKKGKNTVGRAWVLISTTPPPRAAIPHLDTVISTGSDGRDSRTRVYGCEALYGLVSLQR